MDEKLASGIILAILSGLAFLAYKHPDGYHRIYNALLVVMLVGFFSAMFWDLSHSATLKAILPFVDKNKINDVIKTAKEIELPSGKIIIIFVAIYFYLLFLDTLHLILNLKEKKPIEEKRDEKHDKESD